MKLKKIALGVALVAGAATVQAADTLFFPYVVSGGSVTTLVSVINTDTDGVGAQYYNRNGATRGDFGGDHRYLHWRYHIKTANTAAAACLENNGYFPTSPLDLVTYDVSGLRGNDGVMFNDPSVNVNWKAEGAQNSYNAITLNAERATLFVHNAASANVFELAGEAMVVEFDTGAAWGYSAIRQGTNGLSNAIDFDYSFVGPINTGVTLMPMNEITTRFFVTPVNATYDAFNYPMLAADGVDDPLALYGSWTTRVDMSPLTGSIRVLGRDEAGISGGVTPQTVRCVWPVDASDLITAANVRAYTNVQGGWANLVTQAPGALLTPAGAPNGNTQNAVGYKLEFRPAGSGGNFNMGAGVGAFNNAFNLNFFGNGRF